MSDEQGDAVTVGEALFRASCVEVNGGELEPIVWTYKPEGVGIVLANALGLDPSMSVERLRADLEIAAQIREMAECDRDGYVAGVVARSVVAAVLGETP